MKSYFLASAAFALLAGLMIGAGEASAQALERNPAPGLRSQPAPALVGPDLQLSGDPTPLGPNLSSIVLLGAADALIEEPALNGVDVARALVPNTAGLSTHLNALVGRPISRQLLSEIEAAIADHCRRAGMPFVSVTLPPQDVAKGVVQVRVFPFTLSDVSIKGARRDQKLIRNGVRAPIGKPIDAPELQQDLNWLNHSPFRDVTAVFTPGQRLGDTDLQLESAESRRWTGSTGYANSGSASSGYDRYFVAGQVGDLLVRDSLLSLEMTSSDDIWGQGYDPLNGKAPIRYLSHSLVLSVPLAPRQDFTLLLDNVRTHSNAEVFDIRTETNELSAVYRTALSNVSKLPGDLSLGVEMRRQVRNTLYGDISLLKLPTTVVEGMASWSNSWFSNGDRQALSATFRFSPGGSGRSGVVAFAKSSLGRVDTARFSYGQIDYSGEFKAPAGLKYVTQAHGQYSEDALLPTEQMALGGGGAVRGYAYDDQSFDTGINWRNELRLKPVSAVSRVLPVRDLIAPYGFFDAGYVKSRHVAKDETVYSTGFGLDYLLGEHVRAGATAAWALRSAGFTNSGHVKVLAHISLVY